MGNGKSEMANGMANVSRGEMGICEQNPINIFQLK
jgi:hypothetical protein